MKESELMNEQEFEYSDKGGKNREDDDFDQIVGILQDIVIDPAFEKMQNDFLEKYCGLFEEGPGKSSEQAEVYKEYQDALGGFLEEVRRSFVVSLVYIENHVK